MAIIIDDVAGDELAVDSIFALPNKLTLSVLPNHPHSSEIALEAHRLGYEVMLHLPMESETNEA
ncbi:MAG TPA: divergent polysaccharide deacetylase family protein, partial [Candidatus Acidoferrum sp.]